MIRGAREAIVYRPNYSGTIQNNPLFRGAVDTKGFIIGTPGVDVIDVPRPQPEGPHCRPCPRQRLFWLGPADMLIGNGINTIVLNGIATNVTVDHTARDAMQLGFDTVFLEDCCFSSDTKSHRAALVTMRVLCSAVVTGREFLERLPPVTSSARILGAPVVA
jgi:nicotinamidase-related amidase